MTSASVEKLRDLRDAWEQNGLSRASLGERPLPWTAALERPRALVCRELRQPDEGADR
jgi:hypothetical protein